MKYMILIFSLLQLNTAFAADSVVCRMKDFKICKDCSSRVPVYCEDGAYQGSVNLSAKPTKLHFNVTSKNDGSERTVVLENKNLTIKDLKNAKKMESFLSAQKVTAAKSENIILEKIELPTATALYSKQSGTEIAAQFNASTNSKRAIASVATPPQVGGVRKANTGK